MSILKNILSVRSHREAQAQAAVREQSAVVERATAAHQRAAEELEVQRTMAEQREAQWIHELCSRTVRLREISEVQSAIGELRSQTRLLVQALEKAEQGRVDACESLAQCEDRHATAWRLEQRFVELVRLETEQRARHMDEREEGEMNEAAELIGHRPVAGLWLWG